MSNSLRDALQVAIQAENTPGHAVIDRPITHRGRCLMDRQPNVHTRTVLATCQKQGRPSRQFLQNALSAHSPNKLFSTPPIPQIDLVPIVMKCSPHILQVFSFAHIRRNTRILSCNLILRHIQCTLVNPVAFFGVAVGKAEIR